MKTNRAWIWLPTVFAIVHESIVQAGKIFISGHERLLICISGYFNLQFSRVHKSCNLRFKSALYSSKKEKKNYPFILIIFYFNTECINYATALTLEQNYNFLDVKN